MTEPSTAKRALAHALTDNFDPNASPLAVTQFVLAQLCKIPDAVEANWEAELRQIGLAAAAGGDFKSAVDAYKELGRAYGKTAESAPAQHVHFHEADAARDATNEDLEKRLAYLRQRRAEAQEAAIKREELDETFADDAQTPDEEDIAAFLGT